MTRKFITAMLLAATAASPLLAQEPGHFERRGDNRPDEGQHAQPQPRQQQQQQPPQQQLQPPHDRHGNGQGRGGRPQIGGGGQPAQFQGRAAAPDQRGGGAPPQRRFDDRRDGRPGDFTGRSPYNQRSPYDQPPGANGTRGGNWDRDGRGNDGRRDDRRPDFSAGRDRNNGGGLDRNRERRWDNGWRSDRRYDWRGWRNGNRDLFRGPRYAAPRDWSYRRFAPGYRIVPFLFAEQYWIDDPWQYRLPPAYGAYRWVRYYDDVLLVDIRSGMVVDAIPNFFF